MKRCPWKFTELFHTRLRALFYVSNFSRQFDLVKRQFLAGQAKHLNGNYYRVWIKDFPAIVVMDGETLVTINYGE